MNSSTSDSKKRRSERLGLLAAGAAALALLGLILVLEPASVDLIRSMSSFRYQLLLAERSRAEVVAIGDSHMGLGLDSDDARVRNVAFTGENVDEMSAKLDFLLPRLPGARVVLLQAQPHMLYKHRDIPSRDPYKQLSSGRGVYHPFERRVLQFDPCCRGSIPKAALKRLIGRPLTDAEPPVELNGRLSYEPDPSWPDREEMARREIAGYGSTEQTARLRGAYADLVKSLRAKGLTVVLLRLPLSPEYHNLIDPRAMREAESFFGEIARENAAPLCGDWKGLRESRLFLNADHLNGLGAKAYWRKTVAPCLAEFVKL